MGSGKNYRKCPECSGITLRRKKGDFKTYFFKGKMEKELSVPEIEWDECESCGKKMLDLNELKKLSIARYKAAGLFTPEEIKFIRLQLHLSQKAMSKLLRVGEKTYTRWENGAYIQTPAHNEMLKSIAIEYGLRIEIPEDQEIKKIKEQIQKRQYKSTNICKIYTLNYKKNFRESARPSYFKTPRLEIYA